MIDSVQIGEHIQGYIGVDSILGMGIAVVQGEEIIYCSGFGTTSIEEGSSPITPQTIFAIGSTSKTLNALMIMTLVEQGVLDLDRPVVDYLSGFVFSDNPQWGKRVTLRHLLSHTSGLACGFRGWGPRDPDALRRWVWDEMAHFACNGPRDRYHHVGRRTLAARPVILKLTVV
jgi:CubicO group peptidase (beta-lactamase class C family)